MAHSNRYSERIKQLQGQLKTEGLTHFFVKHPVDLFYLTGIQMSLGYLFVSERGGRLFVDGRYFEAASKKSPVPVEELSGEKMVAFLKGGKKLAFEGTKMSFADVTHLRKVARKAKVKVVEKGGVVDQIRAIKEGSEIRLMKKSAEFAYGAYQYLKKRLKPGVMEVELARDLEIYCLKKGAEGMSFEPIIAFGKNTALPHYHPGKTKLKASDIVLFDLGVVLEGYCSDMTRVEFVGKVDPKLKTIYDVNRAAQKMALAKCRPGVRLKELDQAARRVMRSAGLEEYFIHGLGHGIGLEVHEWPRVRSDGADRNVVLEEGMAITIEPGLYLPGKGGVRYEDTIVITQKGYTNLYPEV